MLVENLFLSSTTPQFLIPILQSTASNLHLHIFQPLLPLPVSLYLLMNTSGVNESSLYLNFPLWITGSHAFCHNIRFSPTLLSSLSYSPLSHLPSLITFRSPVLDHPILSLCLWPSSGLFLGISYFVSCRWTCPNQINLCGLVYIPMSSLFIFSSIPWLWAFCTLPPIPSSVHILLSFLLLFILVKYLFN